MVGCDPGFANFGVALAEIDLKDLGNIEIIDTKVFTTSKSKIKTRVSSDDVRRCKEMYKGLESYTENIDLLIAEIPIGGAKSFQAAKALSYATAIVSCNNKSLIKVSPAEVKKFSTGNTSASKLDMIQWAKDRHPEWKYQKTIKANEHMADAIAAIHAGLKSSEFYEYIANRV